jgi:dienelactone hydrolase
MVLKKRIIMGTLLLLYFATVALASPEVELERVEVPLEWMGTTFQLDAMLYKPTGDGPFPAMVITHGTSRKVADRKKIEADNYYVRHSKLFAKMGIAVLFVVRRGFGISEGTYSEFNKYPDGSRNYTQDGLEAAKDLGAAVRYLREQAFVDKTRIVLLGQSTGGHSVLATGSLNLPGVVGVVNFAGGRGSMRPDEIKDEANLIASFEVYGKSFRVPTLWLYSENDHYFGPESAQKFLQAFQVGGGQVEFVLLPPFGDDGHSSFVRAEENWYDDVYEFLQKIGLLSSTELSLSRAA